MQQLCGPESDFDSLLQIFQQQRINAALREKFSDAVALLGSLANQRTVSDSEASLNYAQLSVHILQQSKIQDLLIDDVPKVRDEMNLRMCAAKTLKLSNISNKVSNLNSATILCHWSINSIDNLVVTDECANYFKDIKQEFLNHSQLTDSEVEIIFEALNDVNHVLNWCADFIAMFMFNTAKIFQKVSIFQYCYNINLFNYDTYLYICNIRKEIFALTKMLENRLNSIKNQKITGILNYIDEIFYLHENDILLPISHILSTLSNMNTPVLSEEIELTFQKFQQNDNEKMFVQFLEDAVLDVEEPSKHSKTNDKEICYYKPLSFSQSLLQILINAHILVYNYITPHIVDLLFNDFEAAVQLLFKEKTEEFKIKNGEFPLSRERDILGNEAFYEVSQSFLKFFKIMEIRYISTFIKELYSKSIPEWAYMLLALIHGGNKKKVFEQSKIQAELLKIIHTFPNISSFKENLRKDIDSLNKYSDFFVLFDENVVEEVLESMKSFIFSVSPKFDENEYFISDINITPDPLEFAVALPQFVDNFIILFSSEPEYNDSYVFNQKTCLVDNRNMEKPRNLKISKYISFEHYLESSQTQSFDNVSFLTENIDASIINNEFDSLNLTVPQKISEVEPSRLLQKIQKLAQIASEKMTKYFEVFIKYFEMLVVKFRKELLSLTDIDKLFPSELNIPHLLELMKESVSANIKLIKNVPEDEKLREFVSKHSEEITNKELIHEIVNEYQLGDGPPLIISLLLDNEINDLFISLEDNYNSYYQIKSLPSICYYSSFQIHIEDIKNYLHISVKSFYELHCERTLRYFNFIFDIISEIFSLISNIFLADIFSTTLAIGEAYQAYQLFTHNKYKWQEFFEAIHSKINLFNEFPFGEIGSDFEHAIFSRTIEIQKDYKICFQEREKCIKNIATSFIVSHEFLVEIQEYLDLLTKDIFTRANGYLQLTFQLFDELLEIESSQNSKIPSCFLSDFEFPSLIKIEEYDNVDLKKVAKDIEIVSGMPIFKTNYNELKLVSHKEPVNESVILDFFLELEDVMEHCIDTYNFVYDTELSMLDEQFIDQFTELDILIFKNQAVKEELIQLLQNRGQVNELSKESFYDIIKYDSVSENKVGKLESLLKVIHIVSNLLKSFISFKEELGIWQQEYLSELYLDEVKDMVVEVIKISTEVEEKFPDKCPIYEISSALMEELTYNRTNLQIILFAKQAIYDNGIKSYTTNSIPYYQTDVDSDICIDPLDYALHSQFLNEYLYGNIKVADDTKVAEYIDFLKSRFSFILTHFFDDLKRFRFERLFNNQIKQLNKILSDSDADYIPNSIILEMTHESNESYNVNHDEIFVLGTVEFCKEMENCSIKSMYHYQYAFFMEEELMNFHKESLLETKFDNKILNYIREQKIKILSYVENNFINYQHSEQLFCNLLIIEELTELFWNFFFMAFRINTYINFVEVYGCSFANYRMRLLSSEELKILNESCKTVEELLSGCYTSVSNALQFAVRKGTREIIYENINFLFNLTTSLIVPVNENFVFDEERNISLNKIFNQVMELICYDKYCSPMIYSKHNLDSVKGAVIYEIPTDLNNALSNLLESLGIKDAVFNLLVFMGIRNQQNFSYVFIDGIVLLNGGYFKFIYPLIYQSLHDVILECSIQELQEVIICTLSFHMLFYGEEVMNKEDFDFFKVLTIFPPNIAFFIISEAIMISVESIYTFSSDIEENLEFLRNVMNILSTILENEYNEGVSPSEDELFDIMTEAELSMLTSLENYFFFNSNSVLSNYFAAEHNVQNDEFNSDSNLSSIEASNIKEEEEQPFDSDTSHDDESAENLSVEYSTEISNLNEQQRECLHDGFNDQDFNCLSQVVKAEIITTEEAFIIVYLKSVLQYFISAISTGCSFHEFSLPVCCISIDELQQIVKERILIEKEFIFGELNELTYPEIEFYNYIKIFSNGGFAFSCFGLLKFNFIFAAQYLFTSYNHIEFMIDKIFQDFLGLRYSVLFNTDTYQNNIMYLLLSDIIPLVLQIPVIFIDCETEQEWEYLECIVVLENFEELNENELDFFCNEFMNHNNKSFFVFMVQKSLYEEGINFMELFGIQFQECEIEFSSNEELLSEKFGIDYNFDIESLNINDQLLHFILNNSNIVNKFKNPQIFRFCKTVLNNWDEFASRFQPLLEDVNSLFLFDELSLKKVDICEKLIPDTEYFEFTEEIVTNSDLTEIGFKYLFDLLYITLEGFIQSIGVYTEYSIALIFIKELGKIFSNLNITHQILSCCNELEKGADGSFILQNEFYIVNAFNLKAQHVDDLSRLLKEIPENNVFFILFSDNLEILKDCWCSMEIEHKFHEIFDFNSYFKHFVNRIELNEIFLNDDNVLSKKELEPSEFSHLFCNSRNGYYFREFFNEIEIFMKELISHFIELFLTQYSDASQYNRYYFLFVNTYLQLIKESEIININIISKINEILIDNINIQMNFFFIKWIVDVFQDQYCYYFALISIVFGLIFIETVTLLHSSFPNKIMLTMKSESQFFEQIHGLITLNYNYKNDSVYMFIQQFLMEHENFISVEEYVQIVTSELPTMEEYNTNVQEFEFYYFDFDHFTKEYASNFKDLLVSNHFSTPVGVFNKGSQNFSIFVKDLSIEVNELHLRLEKSMNPDFFITDKSVCTPIQSFYQEFKEIHFVEIGSQLSNLIYILHCSVIFNEVIFFIGEDSLRKDLLYTLLYEKIFYHYKQFNTVPEILEEISNNNVTELQFVISSQLDIARMIKDIKELIIVVDSYAVFLYFTLIKIYVIDNKRDLFMKDLLNFLMTNNISIPDNVGIIRDLELQNFSIVCFTSEEIDCDCKKFVQINVNNYEYPVLVDHNLVFARKLWSNVMSGEYLSNFLNNRTQSEIDITILSKFSQIELPFPEFLCESFKSPKESFNGYELKLLECFNHNLYKEYHNEHLFKLVEYLSHFIYDKENLLHSTFEHQEKDANHVELLQFFTTSRLHECVPLTLHYSDEVSCSDIVSMLAEILDANNKLGNIHGTSQEIILLDFGSMIGMHDSEFKEVLPVNLQQFSSREIFIYLIQVLCYLQFNYSSFQIISAKFHKYKCKGLTGGSKEYENSLKSDDEFVFYSNFGKNEEFYPNSIPSLSVCYTFEEMLSLFESQVENIKQYKLHENMLIYVVVIPLSALLELNLLNEFFEFIIIGNDFSEIFPPSELVDLTPEAVIASNLEIINLGILKNLLFSKVEFHIVVDVPFDFSEYPKVFDVSKLNMRFDEIYRVEKRFTFFNNFNFNIFIVYKELENRITTYRYSIYYETYENVSNFLSSHLSEKLKVAKELYRKSVFATIELSSMSTNFQEDIQRENTLNKNINDALESILVLQEENEDKIQNLSELIYECEEEREIVFKSYEKQVEQFEKEIEKCLCVIQKIDDISTEFACFSDEELLFVELLRKALRYEKCDAINNSDELLELVQSVFSINYLKFSLDFEDEEIFLSISMEDKFSCVLSKIIHDVLYHIFKFNDYINKDDVISINDMDEELSECEAEKNLLKVEQKALNLETNDLKEEYDLSNLREEELEAKQEMEDEFVVDGEVILEFLSSSIEDYHNSFKNTLYAHNLKQQISFLITIYYLHDFETAESFAKYLNELTECCFCDEFCNLCEHCSCRCSCYQSFDKMKEVKNKSQQSLNIVEIFESFLQSTIKQIVQSYLDRETILELLISSSSISNEFYYMVFHHLAENEKVIVTSLFEKELFVKFLTENDQKLCFLVSGIEDTTDKLFDKFLQLDYNSIDYLIITGFISEEVRQFVDELMVYLKEQMPVTVWFNEYEFELHKTFSILLVGSFESCFPSEFSKNYVVIEEYFTIKTTSIEFFDYIARPENSEDQLLVRYFCEKIDEQNTLLPTTEQSFEYTKLSSMLMEQLERKENEADLLSQIIEKANVSSEDAIFHVIQHIVPLIDEYRSCETVYEENVTLFEQLLKKYKYEIKSEESELMAKQRRIFSFYENIYQLTDTFPAIIELVKFDSLQLSIEDAFKFILTFCSPRVAVVLTIHLYYMQQNSNLQQYYQSCLQAKSKKQLLSVIKTFQADFVLLSNNTLQELINFDLQGVSHEEILILFPIFESLALLNDSKLKFFAKSICDINYVDSELIIRPGMVLITQNVELLKQWLLLEGYAANHLNRLNQIVYNSEVHIIMSRKITYDECIALKNSKLTIVEFDSYFGQGQLSKQILYYIFEQKILCRSEMRLAKVSRNLFERINWSIFNFQDIAFSLLLAALVVCAGQFSAGHNSNLFIPLATVVKRIELVHYLSHNKIDSLQIRSYANRVRKIFEELIPQTFNLKSMAKQSSGLGFMQLLLKESVAVELLLDFSCLGEPLSNGIILSIASFIKESDVQQKFITNPEGVLLQLLNNDGLFDVPMSQSLIHVNYLFELGREMMKESDGLQKLLDASEPDGLFLVSKQAPSEPSVRGFHADDQVFVSFQRNSGFRFRFRGTIRAGLRLFEAFADFPLTSVVECNE